MKALAYSMCVVMTGTGHLSSAVRVAEDCPETSMLQNSSSSVMLVGFYEFIYNEEHARDLLHIRSMEQVQGPCSQHGYQSVQLFCAEGNVRNVIEFEIESNIGN